MKPILKAIVPPTDKLGNCTISGISSLYESHKQNILWTYNKMLERDGYEPVKRMPCGTKYRFVAGFGF
jgi:hypothetical protein